MNALLHPDHFIDRHIGATNKEVMQLLSAVKLDNLEELIAETIPDTIRLTQPLDLCAAKSEQEYLQHIQAIAQKNQLWKNYIGMGYYGTITPPVIQRNILENPGWYTQYTPYQAEISQGRLEALLNFQTMVSDLTAMEIANASLLDEGTAAAEAMLMLYRIRNKRIKGDPINVFFVSEHCLPATIAVLTNRAEPLGIELVIGKEDTFEGTNKVFGAILQYPTQTGAIIEYTHFAQQIHDIGAHLVVAADLLSLTLLKPPGEWGADVVVGTTQRFGIPLGYGGPHAAYFATHEKFARQLPGRMIGVSVDMYGNKALRMALQTREQHIRRGKATSNICTAQALLAIMAGMYAVYHGAEQLKKIAIYVHELTKLLNNQLQQLGYQQVNPYFFDTLLLDLRQHTETSGLRIQRVAALDEVNFRYFEDSDVIGISLDETSTLADVKRIVRIFSEAIDRETGAVTNSTTNNKLHIPVSLVRQSTYLTHPIFNTHHSETELMRYIKQLENKDLSLVHAMIPLGSCTMKLNAAAELMPISWANFNQLHPFVPLEQAQGYQQVFEELTQDLCTITGFAGCSLQPNSGAQGEYTGLMVIRAHHKNNGEEHRNIALIPASAHGTNPASAVLAGMKIVVIKCDAEGNILIADLKAKAEKHKANLAALMVTYPSTHGVFETAIQDICAIIHDFGGQIYMDGANMNAQVGLTNPAITGADVCHLNLHKTFSIPHGGGGPGMGPICVAEHLVPYLPSHPFLGNQSAKAIPAIAAAPWSSASILLISYAYIKLLGARGVTEASRYAILNANYIKSRLEKHFPVLYVGALGRVAHELIIDIRPFKKSAGVDAIDVAKRLIDYGFHAPTVSFPVAGTLMIEPTESESKTELDRFCQAMIAIRQEIEAILLGTADAKDNVLKNAPHTLTEVTADNWTHSYSRTTAAYPLPYLHHNKFWASVGRINDSYGDRNLMCSCPPMEVFAALEI